MRRICFGVLDRVFSVEYFMAILVDAVLNFSLDTPKIVRRTQRYLRDFIYL